MIIRCDHLGEFNVNSISYNAYMTQCCATLNGSNNGHHLVEKFPISKFYLLRKGLLRKAISKITCPQKLL